MGYKYKSINFTKIKIIIENIDDRSIWVGLEIDNNHNKDNIFSKKNQKN